MNIFVGNLSFEATEGDVKKLFEGFGNVASVVIVMRKEKKTPKSRGFGFVQMPDEQQALAAIAALNGKEFMGRVLDVNPARHNPTGVALPIPIKEGANPRGIGLTIQQDGLSYPDRKGPTPLKEGPKEGPNPKGVDLPVHFKEGSKAEAHRESKLKKKAQPKFEAKAEEYLQKEREQKKTWFSPVFNKHLALKAPRPNGRAGTPPSAVDGRVRPSGQPGTYKGGRRTHSYMKRRGLAGMQEEAKPRQRSQDNPMRWRKRKDQAKPWQKSPGEHKPWKKTEGEARPWKKAEGEFKPWRKSEGGIKPWKKPAGDAKPWKKPAGDAKPWSKSNGRPQKSRFNPSTSLGMVRGNSERSRTKGRKNPDGYKR
jgi:hypothetical protein